MIQPLIPPLFIGEGGSRSEPGGVSKMIIDTPSASHSLGTFPFFKGKDWRPALVQTSTHRRAACRDLSAARPSNRT